MLLVDSVNRKWTVRHRIQALAILLSADYKEVALGAPTGILRNVARQEDVERSSPKNLFCTIRNSIGILGCIDSKKKKNCSDPLLASWFLLA